MVNTMKEKNMTIKIAIGIGTLLTLAGCGGTKPRVEEQIWAQYDPNKKGPQVITVSQSHGLLGDLMDSTFKTITGEKQ